MSSVPARPEIGLRRAEVGEVSVFYREAGDPERPAILLLHGFPTSSRGWLRRWPPLPTPSA
jgi:pimeloyl-ACP methyl ester carboxylesterase